MKRKKEEKSGTGTEEVRPAGVSHRVKEARPLREWQVRENIEGREVGAEGFFFASREYAD